MDVANLVILHNFRESPFQFLARGFVLLNLESTIQDK